VTLSANQVVAVCSRKPGILRRRRRHRRRLV